MFNKDKFSVKRLRLKMIETDLESYWKLIFLWEKVWLKLDDASILLIMKNRFGRTVLSRLMYGLIRDA